MFICSPNHTSYTDDNPDIDVSNNQIKTYILTRYVSTGLIIHEHTSGILKTRAAESESESESESAGVGSFDRSRSRSRLQDIFIISLLFKMETEIETEHYVLTADSQWFVVYLSLIAGGGGVFTPGWISLQPYLQVGSIIIIGSVTSFGVKPLGLFAYILAG